MDDRAVQRLLAQATSALAAPEALMRSLADAMYADTVEHFETESFDGEKWPPLAERTARAYITKYRRRGHENILRPTGRHLFQTLHQSHTASEARVATPTPWAFVHNFGARLRRMKMPRRTFLAFSDRLLAEVRILCIRYLEELGA